MKISRKQNRLEKFHYKEGCFFVTINVQHHNKIFGEVVDQQMQLNEYGKVVEECWFDLPNHYTNCELADIIIMPNHVHAVIWVEKISASSVREGFKPSPTKQTGLSEIIRGWKTFSSHRIHQLGLHSFQRQRSFYDHIIRNEEDMQRIQEYIEFNPHKRENDEYYR